MTYALFSTAWFAPVEYYMNFNRHQRRMIEGAENYVKQSYRNRCVIAGANGPLTLSLPIESNGPVRTSIRDIKISEHGNWQHIHWNSISSAYNSTPFFEYYADDIHPFFEKKQRYLFDLNEKIREKICELLPIDATAEITTEYIPGKAVSEDILDLRQAIQPNKDLLSKELYPAFKPYYQVFERKFGFIPNLSILDLLFNMGPEAILYL